MIHNRQLDKFFMAILPRIEEGGDAEPAATGGGSDSGDGGDSTEFDPLAATPEAIMRFQTEQPPENPDGGGQENTGKADKPTGDEPEGKPAENEGSEEQKQAKDLEQPPKTDEGENQSKEKAPENEWSEEEKKFFADKGLGDVPFTESNRKLLNIHQDAEKRLTEISQSNSQINSSFGEIGRIIESNDLEGLKEVAERAFGTKLSIDTRTPDDLIKEHTANYNAVLNQFKPVYEHLYAVAQSNPDQADVLNKVADLIVDNLNTMHGNAKSQIDAIKQKELIRTEARRAAGLPEKGQKSTLYKNLSDNAENAFTELRKLDPNADKYIDHVKELTGKGSPLEAAGMTLAKAFGFNGQLANTFYKIGKAMETQRALESGEIEKALWAKWSKEEKNRIDGPPDGSHRSAEPAGSADNFSAKMLKYAETGAL